MSDAHENDLRNQVAALKADYARLTTERDEAHDAVQREQAAHAGLHAMIEAMQPELDDLRADNARLTHDVSELSMTLAAAELGIDSFRADNARLTMAEEKSAQIAMDAEAEAYVLREDNARLRAACEEIAAHDNTTATAWKLVGIARAALPLRPGRSRQ